MGAVRYSFGGDEHIFVELDEEMSLEAFFKGMAICDALQKRRLAGVSEICPANASYLVRFDPDVIHPDEMLRTLQAIEAEVGTADLELKTRIVEIPVLYNDPWTRETLMRFRERHQDPNSTDIGADLRSRAEDALSQGFHGLLSPRRHRQMEADFARGVRPRRRRGRSWHVQSHRAARRVLAQCIPQGSSRLQPAIGGGAP